MVLSISQATTLARNWWALVLRGLIAIAFGAIAWFWPGLALHTIVLLFVGYALVDGVFNIVAAIRAIRTEERWWPLAIEGVISIGAGIVALVWSGITALAFLYIIATWAIITGVLAIAAAIRLRREIVGEWLLALAGLASIVWGIIAFADPGAGALSVLWLIGTFSIFFGAVLTMLGFRLRGLLGKLESGDASTRAAAVSAFGGPAAGLVAEGHVASTAGKDAAATAERSGIQSPQAGSAAAARAESVRGAVGQMAASGTAGSHGLKAAAPSSSEPGGTAVSDDPSAKSTAGASSASSVHAARSEVQGARSAAEGGSHAPSSSSQETRPSATNSAQGLKAPTSQDAAEGRASNERSAQEAETDSAIGSEELEELYTSLPGEGKQWVKGNGTTSAPNGFPIKGNASSRIYHVPDASNYEVTIAEIHFATEHGAESAGFRPRKETESDGSAEASTTQQGLRAAPESASYATPASSSQGEKTTDTGDETRIASATEHAAKSESSEKPSQSTTASEQSAKSAPSERATQAVLSSEDASKSPAASELKGAADATPDALKELYASLPGEGKNWVRGNGTTNAPAEYPIKGNASSQIYHVPDAPNYDMTIAEIHFATEARAILAGFRPRSDVDSIEKAEASAPRQGLLIDREEPKKAEATIKKPERASEAATAVAPGTDPLRDLISDLPEEGSGWVRGTGSRSAPKGYLIKGNASSRIYHVPGGQNYDVTIAEIHFATAADAESAGFRPRRGDPEASETEASDKKAAPADKSADRSDSNSAKTASSSQGLVASNAKQAEDAPTAKAESPKSTGDPVLDELIASLPPEGKGWQRGDGTRTCPEKYPVKGNASSQLFHVPGGRSYTATIPEFCFASPDDAISAGFSSPGA